MGIAIKQHGMLFKPEMVLATMRDIDPKVQTRRNIAFSNSITVPRVSRKQWPELRWDEARLVGAGNLDSDVFHFWQVPLDGNVIMVLPRIKPHDVIWVKEKWSAAFCQISHEYGEASYSKWDTDMHGELNADAYGLSLHYAADGEDGNPAEFSMPHGNEIGWRSSMLMPRWASRSNLNVHTVRSQRIQEISDADAMSEGITLESCAGMSVCGHCEPTCPSINTISVFRKLWESINYERGFGWDVNHPVWIYDFKREVTK